MKSHKERLKDIENHFQNISMKKFEENMRKSGYGKIKPASDYEFKLKNINKEGEDK